MKKKFGLNSVSFILIMLVFCIPAFTRVFLNQDNIQYLFQAVVFCAPLAYALIHVRSKIVFCILFFCLMMLSGTEMFFFVGQKCLVQTAHVMGIFTTTNKEASHFLDNNILYMACTLPQLFCGIAAMIIRCKVPVCRYKTRSLCVATWLSLLCVAYLGVYLQVTPYNIIKCCVLAARQGYNKHRMIPMADGMTFNATRPDINGREYYVMCVGESLRAANMGINGYHRPTTPLLQAMPNVVSFPDFYSTATLTMYSVPMMITRATVDEYNLNYKEYGILKPYRELVDSLTQVYPKAFFLIQLYQSHCYFANFTEQYDVYHPNLVSDKDSDSKDLLVNAYDNTVLYTDYIMSSIIHAIDKPDTRSTFLFASDHGEVLDMDKPRRGGVLNPGKEEYNVGMLFWSSDKWNQAHKDAARRIREIRHEPVNADYLFYTACDMADITIDSIYWKPEYSLLSPQFKPHERKIMLPDGLSVISLDAK